MPMLRVSIQFQHDCPFNLITLRYPHVRMAHWFNINSEYLEVSRASEKELADIRRRLERVRRRGSQVESVQMEEAGTVGFAVRSRKSDSPIIDKLLDRHSALLLPPILYRDGWENYQLLVLDDTRGRALVRDLRRHGEVNITRVTLDRGSVGLESASLRLRELLGSLTGRQLQALRLAYAHGYYALPRKVSLRSLAHDFGVGRSTYEEHVRKAERKVIRAAVPHLELLADALTPSNPPRRRKRTTLAGPWEV
jgi:predicted DNA binding protein